MNKLRKSFLFFILIIFVFIPFSLTKAIAIVRTSNILVYPYPVELENGDIITDGTQGAQFEITKDTLFIWIDLLPRCHFAHPTKYIFIRYDTEEPILIHDGEWPPYLNGKKIMYKIYNQWTVESPFRIESDLNDIIAYFYPMELKPGEVITDGPVGSSYEITSDTLYIWVDLLPIAFFAHPTLHIFIRGDTNSPVIVEKGMWWPLLNGKAILNFQKNIGDVVAPFKLKFTKDLQKPIPVKAPNK